MPGVNTIGNFSFSHCNVLGRVDLPFGAIVGQDAFLSTSGYRFTPAPPPRAPTGYSSIPAPPPITPPLLPTMVSPAPAPTSPIKSPNSDETFPWEVIVGILAGLLVFAGLAGLIWLRVRGMPTSKKQPGDSVYVSQGAVDSKDPVGAAC